ncbi:hypothetical protein AYX14_07033, partial [Cryptococcus neoformans]
QLAHSPVPEAPFPYIGPGSAGPSGVSFPSSDYLRDLVKWASEAADRIKQTGCEIPEGLGLNPGDLYLGPGSIIAIEGAIQTVCQAVDHVVQKTKSVHVKEEPSTPPMEGPADALFTKAFCAIRPPGHHCGEDAPSGFCYVNNVVIGALHGYLQHDIDRAIIIDFDLHHGNGTQALVMPLNAASYADDIQVKAGKPPVIGQGGRRRRGWKAFYGSVHDIYSYPCEDGDLDFIRDASISLAAHGQYMCVLIPQFKLSIIYYLALTFGPTFSAKTFILNLTARKPISTSESTLYILHSWTRPEYSWNRLKPTQGGQLFS